MNSDFDLITFYSQYINIDHINPDGEVLVTCPFHKDNKPSLSINVQGHGLWKCHAQSCPTNKEGKGGGDVYRFYALMEQVSIADARIALGDVNPPPQPEPPTEETEPEPAIRIIEEEPVKKPSPLPKFPVSEREVEENHLIFICNKQLVDYVCDNFGWTPEVIMEYEIGYDGQRIWIPIREHGRLANIRKYAPNPKNGNKVVSIAGFGQSRLWPLENTSEFEIYLFEGEKDCILANALGLNAITITGGAGSWNAVWLPLFKDKTVYICYDIDEAGQSGAEKVSAALSKVTESVKIVKLDINEPNNADFTDYILSGKTLDDFKTLCESSKPAETPDTSSIQVPEEVVDTTLDRALTDKLFYKRSKMRVRAIGKHEQQYMIPKSMRVTCNRDNNNCTSCALYGTADETIILDESRAELLDVLVASSRDKRRLVKELFGLAPCRKYMLHENEHQFIEDIQVIPTVDDMFEEQKAHGMGGHQKYEERHMYLLNERIDVNCDYEISSVMFKHPLDNHIVHVGYELKRCQSSLDEFKLTDEIKKKLRTFQCKELGTNSMKSTETYRQT